MLLVVINFVVTAIGPTTINTSSDLPNQHTAEFLAKKAKVIEKYGEEYYRKAYDVAPGLKALTKLHGHPKNFDTHKVITNVAEHEDLLAEYAERLDLSVASCMRRTSMLKRAFDRFDSGLLSPEFVAREDHMTQVAMYEAVMALDRARSAMRMQGREADFPELIGQIDGAVTRVEKTKGEKGLGR
ncbi:hypothetical protein HBI82_128930 [Parastagonospora nodorum]|nr:hypothetical protein HBI20_180910 [Parastagonospora nodorum]KAH6010278.1 hypothetical protein HBI82_128930 [Parastagonospora nodorum]